MSRSLTTVAVGGLIAIALAFAPTVYAEQSPGPATNDSHRGDGMRHGGMMGMRGGMMGQMRQMMEGCNAMMQSQNQPPNSQFHRPSEHSQENQ